jgi:ParB family chromosome partitioning protein
MENKRQALGRGLEQLFSNEVINISSLEKNILDTANKNDIVQLDLTDLRSNPYQPRQSFDEEKLQELADSIKEFGVIQPIIVKKSIKGYEIIAGERRVKASLIAGKKTIPAIVKDFSDEEMMQIALLENIQREDLSPIEEAEAYKNLITSLGITQEEFSKRIGKSRSYITNMLGLLRLPKSVQKMVLDKKISMGHARVLSKLEDKDKIIDIASRIVNEDMSVRKVEELLNNPDYLRQKPIVRITKKSESKYNFIQDILRDKIGTMVKINNKSIIIPFDSEKDLERILEILKIDVDVNNE